ncbi:hypothetical protein [Clostridium estertheticum]|uniref:Uncharacterized protein n=1 Tax=Clostridium estertheticum subsp. estertheticum TaxID=1552 RepID=A0A1J0GJN8_9CLOT|nr:hypothetical protein [Clostridium estertheticum]APC41553.1 hypothetical protein A7L45_16445 [Clostridium estertheticum subsp. estertheticum]
MQRLNSTMLGQVAYTLKHIAHNEGIELAKLRYDIKVEKLVPSGKTCGCWYVVQTELDRYLKKWNEVPVNVK